VSVELTYGLLRLAMYTQGVEHVKDLQWGGGLTWGDVMGQFEREFSAFNFEHADVETYRRHFDDKETEAEALIEAGLVHPAYDAVIKCSHLFNVLEARGAISVTERTGYIKRVRALSRGVARAYLTSREELGFPLLNREDESNG
jgi:glycyl-tRNA synthetase alpha chain